MNPIIPIVVIISSYIIIGYIVSVIIASMIVSYIMNTEKCWYITDSIKVGSLWPVFVILIINDRIYKIHRKYKLSKGMKNG